MTYDTILYDVADDVATITFNRPEVRNGLSSKMRAEMLHGVTRAQDEARVLVTTGAGEGYCSGQDLGDSGTAAELDLLWPLLRMRLAPFQKYRYPPHLDP